MIETVKDYAEALGDKIDDTQTISDGMRIATAILVLADRVETMNRALLFIVEILESDSESVQEKKRKRTQRVLW